MICGKTEDGKFLVRSANLGDVPQMSMVQLTCFPTLAQDKLLTEVHYSNHINLFPEGQLVVAKGDKIIASYGTLRMHFPKPDHTFMDATDNLWITKTHLPKGDWLYQFDFGIVPEYRGLKLSKMLYNAQQNLAKSLGMKGQITVGVVGVFYGGVGTILKPFEPELSAY